MLTEGDYAVYCTRFIIQCCVKRSTVYNPWSQPRQYLPSSYQLDMLLMINTYEVVY